MTKRKALFKVYATAKDILPETIFVCAIYEDGNWRNAKKEEQEYYADLFGMDYNATQRPLFIVPAKKEYYRAFTTFVNLFGFPSGEPIKAKPYGYYTPDSVAEEKHLSTYKGSYYIFRYFGKGSPWYLRLEGGESRYY